MKTKKKVNLFDIFTKQMALIFIVLIAVIMTFVSPYFWSLKNMHDLVIQTSTYGVLLAGTTFILICGGCDLSLGGNFCLAGITVIMMSSAGFPLWLGVIVALLLGAVVGIINAFLVVYQKAEAFIITLGVNYFLRGVCKVLTDSKPVGGTNEAFQLFGTLRIVGISVIIYIFIVLIIISSLVLTRTQFGRNIYAVGGNFSVAEYSGINARRIKCICFVISGVIGALGGVLFSARMNSGSSNYGEYIPLLVNCSAVIGGTSFGGGRGNIVKSVSGILLLCLLEISMNLAGISSYIQMLTKGILIVGIVALDCYTTMKRHKTS